MTWCLEADLKVASAVSGGVRLVARIWVVMRRAAGLVVGGDVVQQPNSGYWGDQFRRILGRE